MVEGGARDGHRPAGPRVPVVGRVFLFLAIALAAAGAILQIERDALIAGIGGLLIGAVVVSKIEARVDFVSCGIGALGAAALVAVELFPSAADCNRQRSHLAWLGEQQEEAVAYWEACTSPASADVDWCADYRPERSLEDMSRERDKTFRRIVNRCGGLALQRTDKSRAAEALA